MTLVAFLDYYKQL